MHRLVAALIAVSAVACGGKTPPAAEPRAAEPAGDDAPAAADGSPVAAEPDEGASTSAGPGYGSPGTTMPPSALAAAAPALQAIAASEARGMAPDGGLFGGQLAEGQTLQQPINLQAGRCYTIVAVGDGIDDLAVQLSMEMPPMPATVLAQSQGSGSTAVVGGSSTGCWKNPTPIGGPGVITLTARRGAGLAAAQVYVK